MAIDRFENPGKEKTWNNLPGSVRIKMIIIMDYRNNKDKKSNTLDYIDINQRDEHDTPRLPSRVGPATRTHPDKGTGFKNL
jgi:hypothetical protein